LIAAALNRLVRLGSLEKSPVARIRRGKEPARTRAVLSKDECARLLDACDPHFRPLVLAALLTGARPCELKALTWGDVSFGNRTITIFRTKVGLATRYRCTRSWRRS
jgi:integrase